MIRIFRHNTYKVEMPLLSTEFFDFRGAEDEATANLLSSSLTSLFKRADKKLRVDLQHKGFDKPPHSDQVKALNKEVENVKAREVNSTLPQLEQYFQNAQIPSLTTLLSAQEASSTQPHMCQKYKNMKRNVVLPHDMVPRLVRDVVRMCEGEQNGIRGCTVVLELEDRGSTVRLGRVVCDPRIPSTCELHLRLRRTSPPEPEDTYSIPFFSFLNNRNQENIYISPGYTVEKLRIHRKFKKQVTFKLK